MNVITRNLVAAAIAAITIVGVTAVRAADWDSRGEKNTYVVTALVSDLAGKAKFQDPVLQNSWGVAFSPAGSPFWIADNATGCSTLYDGAGVKQALQVSIPLPGKVGVPSTDCQTVKPPPAPPPTPTPAAPTGIIWNPSAAFVVPGTVSTANPKGIPAIFIFDTEDGTISAWAGGLTPPPTRSLPSTIRNPRMPHTAPSTKVSHSASTSTERSSSPPTSAPGRSTCSGRQPPLALRTWQLIHPRDDRRRLHGSAIPAGFAPFGIQNINGDLFVTYAKQNAQKHDDVAGPGNGFVDVFDTDGHLLRRFASRGPLNSPWGVARASFAFGRFSGEILVGNFGNGKINVFDSRGRFIDELDGPNDKPLVIDGLWTLTLGGGANSSSDTLYFTAGPNGETDGLFGTIIPVSKDKDD